MAAGPILTFSIDSTRRDIDVSREIKRYEPNASPFTVLMMNSRKKMIGSTETHWYDQPSQIVWSAVNNDGGYNEAAEEFVFDDVSFLTAGDLIKFPRTGEVCLVKKVTAATNTIEVVRSVGATAAAALNNDDPVHRLGTAMEEASSAPESRLFQPDKLTNYTQIVRTTWDGSRTEDDEDLKTSESERTRNAREKALEHKRDIERVLLFGEKSEDSTGKRRTCGGLTEFIKTNVIAVPGKGTVTEDFLEKEICEPLFKYDDSDRLCVCSQRWFTIFNRFANGKLEVLQSDKTYGVRISKYISAHGNLLLVTSKELVQSYAYHMFMLSMKDLRYRPYRNADTKLRTNIQSPDFDGYKDEYLTEFTLEVRREKNHAIITNGRN
jgi:hypothetical protein